MRKKIKYKLLILKTLSKLKEKIHQNRISIKIHYNKDITKKQNICLCTSGKLENRYIREYVMHYEKYGVDKIFLYDNNDINGERFETVIGDFVEKGFVEIIIFYEIHLFL